MLGDRDGIFQNVKRTIKYEVNKSDIYQRKYSFNKKLPHRSFNRPCGYCYWTKTYQQLPHRQLKNVSYEKQNAVLMFYGDSLTYRFRNHINRRPLCTIMFSCVNSHNWVYPVNLSEQYLYDNKDFNETKFLGTIGNYLRNKKIKVFVFNFGLHFIMSLPFDRCMNLFELFLRLIRDTKRMDPNTFPLLIWKSTTNANSEVFLTRQVNLSI